MFPNFKLGLFWDIRGNSIRLVWDDAEANLMHEKHRLCWALLTTACICILIANPWNIINLSIYNYCSVVKQNKIVSEFPYLNGSFAYRIFTFDITRYGTSNLKVKVWDCLRMPNWLTVSGIIWNKQYKVAISNHLFQKAIHV